MTVIIHGFSSFILQIIFCYFEGLDLIIFLIILSNFPFLAATIIVLKIYNKINV